MASFNSTDADIESFTSGDTDFDRICSTPERGIQFLVFNCGTEFLAAGEIIKRRALTSTEKAQRDVILGYRNPNCITINNDQYPIIFGSNHDRFLSNIHSILVLLPCDPKNHVTFFISKRFANTPVYTSQNESLLESPAPFFCRSLQKPVTLDNLVFIKGEMSSDLQLSHDKENAEKHSKIEHFNNSLIHAHYLDVVKHKSNIIKFVYHKSYQTSHTLHIECQSTDTVNQVFNTYIKRASKDLPEFLGNTIEDFSVSDDDGTRIDDRIHAFICLLYSENLSMKGKQLSHSYPSFLIHLTPKLYNYFPIKVRIHGEEKGHMHPFTVFVRNDFSTAELRNEISKHCHWNPKSFEVCLPNSHKSIDDVDNLKNLNFQLNLKTVLSVHRIQKLKLTIECNLTDIESVTFEEFPMCSIEILKNKISKRCNILPKQFDLIYKNKILEENILLESIIEKNAKLELKINENRMIFRLYLHKQLPNRTEIDIYDSFVHLKVDDPDREIGEITSSFAEKLSMVEEDLHVSHKGFYLEKTQSYTACNIVDGAILCLCHCENTTRGDNSSSVDTVFQADPSGTFEKVTEASVAAMEMKLRKLQLQNKKKEPNVHIIYRRPNNQKIFHRMISVPSQSNRNSFTVDSGYKSDTDLVNRNKGPTPKPSPSDSQLNSHAINNRAQTGLHLDTQLVTTNQVPPSFMLTPPSTPGAKIKDHNRPSSLPGSTGFHLMYWTNQGGNIPNIADIIGQPTQGVLQFPTDNGDPYSKLFLQISKEIAPDWKTVGIYLDLGEGNLNIIDQNNTLVENKAYNMLSKWRKINGSKATKEKLINALEDCELKRVAEIVEGFPLAAENDYARQESDVSDLEIDGLDISDDDSD